LDFAGSGVVHMTGGLSGLIGAIVAGPRIGRYVNGKDMQHKFKPHNVPLLVIGTLILWFGWFGFNAGS
jgi:Amt family ammonium transporter